MDTLQLQYPTHEFSVEERIQLAQILSSPLMRRYLQALLWNQIIDEANIPVPLTAEDERKTLNLSLAVKGGVSMLNTLLNFDKETGVNSNV